jgi:Prokaryotic N-terminal methylation motif
MLHADSPARTLRRGFTVIELMVALLVGMMTISGARAISSVLVDHAARLDSVHVEVAEEMNGEHLLRRLVLEAEAGRDPKSTFFGSRDAATFESWCQMPGGWTERCSVALRIERLETDSVVTLVGELSTGERLPLIRLPAPVHLTYLEDATHGGSWSARWGPGTVAPLAIGIFAADQLLILPTRREP